MGHSRRFPAMIGCNASNDCSNGVAILSMKKSVFHDAKTKAEGRRSGKAYPQRILYGFDIHGHDAFRSSVPICIGRECFAGGVGG